MVIFSTSGKFITKFNVLGCISLSETLFSTGARGRIPVTLTDGHDSESHFGNSPMAVGWRAYLALHGGHNDPKKKTPKGRAPKNFQSATYLKLEYREKPVKRSGPGKNLFTLLNLTGTLRNQDENGNGDVK